MYSRTTKPSTGPGMNPWIHLGEGDRVFVPGFAVECNSGGFVP